MINTRSAGGVVFNAYRQVLVVNQNHNSWSLPKGHVEEGENDLEAARREIAEESGVVELNYLGDLGIYVRHRIGLDGKDDLSQTKSIHMFLFFTNENTLSPADPRNPEARWVKCSEVSSLLTHSKDREFFERIRPGLERA